MTALTVENGNAGLYGGGIQDAGNLTLTNCLLTHNTGNGGTGLTVTSSSATAHPDQLFGHQ